MSGPCLRGAGLEYDLRKEDGYSSYSDFEFKVPVGTGKMGSVGDCWDRYWVRVLEIEQSISIIRQALDKLPDGDVSIVLKSACTSNQIIPNFSLFCLQKTLDA